MLLDCARFSPDEIDGKPGTNLDSHRGVRAAEFVYKILKKTYQMEQPTKFELVVI